ncbi:unnamed protein product [Allacma fusca]|uniref:C2H2-type domain-containing protein n=1 Tax=Allacma fusca TaxID=39272 RepID=A0A8J2JJ16_9HEXA|nr:unnamed protein product [Allacma fusca]
MVTSCNLPYRPLPERLERTRPNLTFSQYQGWSRLETKEGKIPLRSTTSLTTIINCNKNADSDYAEGQKQISNIKNERKKKNKRSPVCIYDHITVLDGEPQLYQCNVCSKKFKTKAHIKYHEFCQNGEKPFKCEQCGQGFIAKSHYEYHLRTHTGERPYVCPKCGKGFNQKGKVTRHMRSHTGEKPFICQQCGRGFSNAQALRSHFLIHTGERPYACNYCKKAFTGLTNLKKHLITHTGERPYECTDCGKAFGLKWTLDLHLRTHSAERPYSCEQCTRAFTNSKDLRRHLVIHSGERPFKCWICGTAFRRKDNLDRHIKNTHHQPKEVAKQLANEAAAEYLATKAKSDTQQNVISKSTRPRQERRGAPGGSNEKGEKNTSEIFITADLSPPDSPYISARQSLPSDLVSKEKPTDTLPSSSAVSTHEDTISNSTSRKKTKLIKNISGSTSEANQTVYGFADSKPVGQTQISKPSSGLKQEGISGEPVPSTSQHCLMISSESSNPNKNTTNSEMTITQVKLGAKASPHLQHAEILFSLSKKLGPSGKNASITSSSRRLINSFKKKRLLPETTADDQTEEVQIEHGNQKFTYPQEASKTMDSLENPEIESLPSTSHKISILPGKKIGNLNGLGPLKVRVNKKGIYKFSKFRRGNLKNSVISRTKPPLVQPSMKNDPCDDISDISVVSSPDSVRENKCQEPKESQAYVESINSETLNEMATSGGYKALPSAAKPKRKREHGRVYSHISIVNGLAGERPMYKCLICTKKFKTKAHMKYHEFCQNGEKPFKCEQCGKGLITKSHYEYHIRTHTGVKPYPCPKCGKRFNQRGKVTRHMQSHTSDRPFVCQQCGRGFRNPQSLRSHFFIHTGERPFQCKFCTRAFTGLTNLKKHLLVHTGERSHVCTHCGKSFGLKWTLGLHMRTHSAERPFPCDQCTRRFSNSKDLRRHLVIHSGIRPFQCWICGTAFRRKDNLDRHIKSTHNQPKEVAKALCDRAAEDYFAKSGQISNSTTNSCSPGANTVESNRPNHKNVRALTDEEAVPEAASTDQTGFQVLEDVPAPETVVMDDTDGAGEGKIELEACNSTSQLSDELATETPRAVKVEIPEEISPSVPVDFAGKSEVDTDIYSSSNSSSTTPTPSSEEKPTLDTLGVIITAESSPPGSIFTVSAEEASYILPDCQSVNPSNNFKEERDTTESRAEINSQDFDGDLLSYAHLQYFHHIS